ncbi:MAG: transposase [Ruminococcus sp.]|nr:transposase [Ruminococcus sp.]
MFSPIICLFNVSICNISFLYRTKYRSEKELRTAIDNYMTFYNEQRLHTKNGYKTPSKKEIKYHERHK